MKTILSAIVVALMVTSSALANPIACQNVRKATARLCQQATKVKGVRAKRQLQRSCAIAKARTKKICETKKAPASPRLCIQVVVCAQPPMRCDGEVCAMVMPTPRWYSNPCYAQDDGATIVDGQLCRDQEVSLL